MHKRCARTVTTSHGGDLRAQTHIWSRMKTFKATSQRLLRSINVTGILVRGYITTTHWGHSEIQRYYYYPLATFRGIEIVLLPTGVIQRYRDITTTHWAHSELQRYDYYPLGTCKNVQRYNTNMNRQREVNIYFSI